MNQSENDNYTLEQLEQMAKDPQTFPPEMLDRLLEERSKPGYVSQPAVDPSDDARAMKLMVERRFREQEISEVKLLMQSTTRRKFELNFHVLQPLKSVTLINEVGDDSVTEEIFAVVSHHQSQVGSMTSIQIHVKSLIRSWNKVAQIVDFFLESDSIENVKDKLIHMEGVRVANY